VLLPRLPDVGCALLKCDGERHRCSLPICAVCARAYRESPIAQLHALANAYAGPHEVATIYLSLIRPGCLAAVDVPRAREMFRKRLDRAGFKGTIVVGGIEVAWQENWQRWLLHAHVLAIGVDANAWERLEAALEDNGTAKPVDHVPLRDPAEQLSTASSSLAIINPDAALSPCRRIASSNSRSGGRDIASRTSCSPMAPVVAAVASSSTSSRAGVLCPARLSRGDGGGVERVGESGDRGRIR
jgi:hypothetical protein